jgi:hypothetical protein
MNQEILFVFKEKSNETPPILRKWNSDRRCPQCAGRDAFCAITSRPASAIVGTRLPDKPAPTSPSQSAGLDLPVHLKQSY